MSSSTPKHEFTPDMREIGGFGGRHEAMCQEMMLAGLDWLDTHPDAKLTPAPGKRVSPDFRALRKAVAKVAPGATGAMVDVAWQHAYYAHLHGWDAYVTKMIQLKAGE